MATINQAQNILTQVLTSVQKKYQPPSQFRTLPIFDSGGGNYLLMDEGWDGYRRIHRVWAHVEFKDGKYWIHEDGTEEGIANLLVAAGVPRDQIVLAFYDPVLREATEFAVA